jgi:hypothetical protein
MLALTLWRLQQVGTRLLRLGRAGRVRQAARIALSNPLLNSYFIFSVFMLLLYVWTANRFGAQGRNWFPLLLPIFLTGLVYAPRAVTQRGVRRALTAVAATGLLLYCVVGAYYARASIRERFYWPKPQEVRSVPLEPRAVVHSASATCAISSSSSIARSRETRSSRTLAMNAE